MNDNRYIQNVNTWEQTFFFSLFSNYEEAPGASSLPPAVSSAGIPM